MKYKYTYMKSKITKKDIVNSLRDTVTDAHVKEPRGSIYITLHKLFETLKESRNKAKNSYTKN
uniref:Uncharacterized protein n=1 Tax=viral metagenome TaxID=1070528 RepID=A0A6C0CK70_9ZZZZ